DPTAPTPKPTRRTSAAPISTYAIFVDCTGNRRPFSSVRLRTPESLLSASVINFSTSLGVCALLKISSRGLSVIPILTSTLDPFRSCVPRQEGYWTALVQCRAGPYASSETAATEPSPDRDQRPSASTSFVTSVSIASAPNIARNDRDSCMNRPYTAHSPYSLSPTERIPSHSDDGE